MKKKDKELIECARKLKRNCIISRCGSCCLKNKERRCFVRDGYGDKTMPENWYIPSLKPALTDVQKAILGSIDEKYKWIAKDGDGSVYVYTEEPNKSDGLWEGLYQDICCLDTFKPELFDFLSWKGEEPAYIPDLLKEE